MRRLLVAAVVVSCAIHHHVRVVLGPADGSSSNGYECRDPLDPTKFLFARAVVDGHLRFNLVVDLIDLGGQYPGCLAEQIHNACTDASGNARCKLLRSAAPTRVCVPVDVPIAGDPGAAIAKALRDQYSTVIDNAPDQPVILRAVATTQSCGSIQTPAGSGDWPNLASDNTPGSANTVLGCAYSCPVLLDQVADAVYIGIDIGLGTITNDQCISAIDECAVFPAAL